MKDFTLNDETTVELWYRKPTTSGEEGVGARAFRLHDHRLEALSGEKWIEILYYNGHDHHWYDREDKSPLVSLALRGRAFRPLHLAVHDVDSGGVVSELPYHGALVLPTPTAMNQLARLNGISAEQWPQREVDSDGLSLAVHGLIGYWNNGNDLWPERCSGDIVIRTLHDWELTVNSWDGAIGALSRPSALAGPTRKVA